MLELTHDLVQTIMSVFEKDMKLSCHIYESTNQDFVFAKNLLLQKPKLGLRTPDALHLAISHNRGAELYSLDQKLVSAAREYGILASNAGISL